MSAIPVSSSSVAADGLAGMAGRVSSAWTGLMSWLFSEDAGEADTAQSRHDAAEHVRALARRVEATQPGFASDLYAAAARHEGYEA
jgi:hypothetical protein